MFVLAVIIVALIAAGAGLFVAMFRRDEAVLGLAGLTAVLAGAMAAVVYAGLDSL